MSAQPAHRPVSQRLILHLLRRSELSKNSRASSQQGLTIMECLVAIILIVVTIAMVAPPLVLATATRVQNRRAAQALQVAQGEVDRIRTIVAMGNHSPANLPREVAGTRAATLPNVAVPNAIDPRLRTLNPTGARCSNRFDPVPTSPYNTSSPYNVAATSVMPVDVDGDCKPEYLMQVFRTPGLVSSAEQATGRARRPSEFDVGIRVYPIQAAINFTPDTAINALTLADGLESAPAPLQLTSGTLRRRPLAVLYTKFTWTEEKTSLCSYFSQADRQRISSCSGVFPAGSP